VTLTPRQATIVDWLKRLNPNVTDLFVSALVIAEDESIPSRGRLVAHAYREICNAIMNRYSTNSRIVPRDQMHKFAEEFRKLGISFEGPAAAPPIPDATMTPVPHSFLRAAAAAVRAHEATDSARDRARAVIEGVFGKRASQPGIEPMADRWFRMSSSFHKWAHHPIATDAEILGGQMKTEAEYLEESLLAFAEEGIGNLDALDDILESANS
jgi:hypothetical protein